MNNQVLQQNPDNSWSPAKQEPYYPSLLNKVKCVLGFHELFVSRKYRATKTCFKCGKRKVGVNEK